MLSTGILALCFSVGCDFRTDVDERMSGQVNRPSLTSDVDDIQAAALSAMFSAEIDGDVPSDRRYLAVMLFEKRIPDSEFLRRHWKGIQPRNLAEFLVRRRKRRGFGTAAPRG